MLETVLEERFSRREESFCACASLSPDTISGANCCYSIAFIDLVGSCNVR